MFWSKKKKLVENTSTLIRTNPLAREASLLNRKKLRDSTIKNNYSYIIDRINDSIGNGEFECHLPITCDNLKFKYTQREAYIYLAARQLRKDGFKVKVNKRIKNDLGLRNTAYGVLNQQGTYKSLTVSWK